MIPHPFKADPHGRDVCDAKTDEDGRTGFCGQRRDQHMDEVRSLQIQLATALRERDEARALSDRLETAARAYIEGHEFAMTRAEAAESERDALRTALTEVNDLLMSVPPREDWRTVVREKVVVALFGEAAWETK